MGVTRAPAAVVVSLMIALLSMISSAWAQAPRVRPAGREPSVEPPGSRVGRDSGGGPIEITGATLAEYDEATGKWRLEGAPVIVTRGHSVVRAARAQFDERARIVTAQGGVEMTEPGLALRADAAELWIADERIRATGNVRLTSTREGQAVTLIAPEAEGSLATRRFVASGGVSITRGEATVTGRRVEYDDREQVAVVTGEPEVRYRDGVVTADVVTAWLAREHVRGEGSVRFRRADLTGSARRVDVRLREQLAILSGAARVERGRDRLDAEEIQVELDRSRATARGNPRLTITPP